jgi:hypothetical protein
VGTSPALVGARRAAVRAFRITQLLPAPVLPVREELPHLLNRRGLLGCAVEVGVKEGEFSELLLRSWRGRHLISVDPWRAAPDDYRDVANVPQAEHDAYHRQTQARLAQFGERSTVWRMTGAEAAARVPHHSLDFAYLDARHDRESVLADLADWFDKVRPGGIVAGHDYVDGELAEGRFGVKRAVDGFFGPRRLRVHVTGEETFPSWIVELDREPT